jgi:hypothetical protein
VNRQQYQIVKDFLLLPYVTPIRISTEWHLPLDLVESVDRCNKYEQLPATYMMHKMGVD